MKDGFEYHYYLKDHLGSTRVVLSQAGETLQQNSYYPFGMLMEGSNAVPDYNPYQNKYLYNGKELQTDFGLDWYDYGARFYDAELGRWSALDPKSEVNRRWSPYRYAYDNPLRFMDPAGMLEDGYEDFDGNYKWFDSETEGLIQKEGKIWLHVADSKSFFEMAKAGIFDNIPEQTDPGEINGGIDKLTTFEMWLDSPSENIGEGFKKGAMNMIYSFVNSPSVLLTGKTLGGTEANPKEKMNAFIDVAPILVSFGLTSTKEIVNLSKVTNKGFSRFNKFVEKVTGATTTEGLPAGTKWQTRASQLYKANKVNQATLKGLNIGTFGTSVLDKTSNELHK